MIKFILIFLLLFLNLFTHTPAQKIGEIAPEKTPEIFPNNAWGIDIMFGESGFGLGSFYRYKISQNFTTIFDISFAESKDQREIEYYDYWGNSFVIGKKNRVFQIPMFLGLQYRMFPNSIADNLRPYLFLGTGPSLIVTTAYQEEFFSSFENAKSLWAVGGYIGIGTDFGLDKSSLSGINVRYYFIKLPGQGVESLYQRFQRTLTGIFITLNLGLMY